MRQFSTNIQGRVKETKVSVKDGYIALLEAISNSIHAINDRKISDGLIKVIITREKIYQDDFLEAKDVKDLSIENIKIEDNGVRFNQDNFNSFMRCNSEYKMKYGAKGVGRFTWLKVFNEVEIESIYNDGELNKKISFTFKPIDQIDEKYEETQNDVKTIVKLKNLKSEYSLQFPSKLDDLAKKIINHFFINFITQKIPTIIIEDEYETINLNQFFNEMNNFKCEKTNIKILGLTFDIYHIRSTTIDNANKLFLCANTRVVEPIDLRKHIKNLQSTIGEIDGKKVWYFSYICSSYLDEIVNSERTQINFPYEDSEMVNCINISKETFLVNVCSEISKHLRKDIEKIEVEKIERINRYIDTQRPNYKNLRQYRPNFYKNIENNLTDDKLELALFKEKLEWNKEINAQYEKIIKKAKTLDLDSLNELKQDYLLNTSQYGKDCLAEYIIKRKSILDMLENYISSDDEGKYSLEEAVHSLICPLRTTSEQLSYNDMNLWFIDEKLEYHF